MVPSARWAVTCTLTGEPEVAVEADGSLGQRELFIRFEPEWGTPDGMTLDSEGGLWVAHWGGGRVSRFTPEGRFERSIALPASQITSCTFAGPKRPVWIACGMIMPTLPWSQLLSDEHG